MINAGMEVLNLIITGIPSIQINSKWMVLLILLVLNLIITGIPSIRYIAVFTYYTNTVLNLIITGIPSILDSM